VSVSRSTRAQPDFDQRGVRLLPCARRRKCTLVGFTLQTFVEKIRRYANDPAAADSRFVGSISRIFCALIRREKTRLRKFVSAFPQHRRRAMDGCLGREWQTHEINEGKRTANSHT